MLTNLIIKIIGFVGGGLINLLPDMTFIGDVFSNAENNAQVVKDFIANVNFIVPLPTIVTIAGIEISMHIAMFTLWIGNQVKKTIVSLIP